MRIAVFLLLILVSFISCEDVPVRTEQGNQLDTLLILPSVKSGTSVDTSLSSIRISAIIDSEHKLTAIDVRFSSDSLRDTVNIYADSSLAAWMIDSVINEQCSGRDLRLIGQINGQPVAIPFHWMNRFLRKSDSIDLPADLFHIVRVHKDGIQMYPEDSLYSRKLQAHELGSYFKRFYGNAFDPLDSLGFPEREPWRQTISVLATEGQSWDMVQMGVAPDTAAQLASYNEFVNKLEIYDKVGEFNRLPIALIDINYYPLTKWGVFLSAISTHHKVQSDLRTAAQKHLADKIANEGNPPREFTDEDLLLLYPDRLRWNGWMSGPTEHYYDAFHLRVLRLASPLQAGDY